jgi:tetratricopeptide (TPR) repeat protein
MPPAPDPVTEQFQRGLALHQAGRLREARTFYEAVIRRQPSHAAALHLLGLLAVTEGRSAEGIEHYQACLRAEPAFVAAWTNLGNALLAAGRADEAVAAQRRALALEPGLAEAHCNLGQALHAQGHFAEAAAALAQAVALKPRLAEAHNSLGNALKSQGRFEEALAAYRHALGIRPNYPDAWYNLGNILLSQGHPEEAESAYGQAVALAPNHAEALVKRSQALRELGRMDEALAACGKALELQPDFALAHTNLGKILQAGQRWQEAIASHRRAITLRGDLVEGWSNLGNSLVALNRLDEALKAYEEALRRLPGSAELGYNVSLIRLLQGELPAAWEGYELRWRLKALRPRPVQDRPAWDGRESLAGKSIVVYAEQGCGDTLQFARYLPRLAERGARVHAVVQKSLHALVGRVQGVAAVSTAEQPWPECDFHCPLLSLPRAFGTTLASVPAAVPYVSARSDRREAAAGWLAAAPFPKIGVAWSGNPSHPNDRNRSLPLEALLPALGQAAPRWISLQKELRPGERETLGALGVVDLSGQLRDFDDTAGVLAGLDLVVTVDTAVAHLAGAMGIPTWILLPYAPDWRWLLEREDSPWYPTARLFRQTEAGSWAGVLDRVAAELARWKAAKIA